MALLNIWSRRKRATLPASGDPLSYDAMPQKLRVQIAHVLMSIFELAKRVEYGFPSNRVLKAALREAAGGC